jgi:hypothetical protein
MSKLNSKVVKKSIYSKGGNESYTQGQTLQFQIPEKDGFLIPESLNISYTFTPTISVNVLGIPLYAPILNFETYLNDVLVEQINNYNVIHGFLIANGLYNAGERLGMTEDYGLIYSGSINMEGLNYGILTTTPTNFGGKLECILRNFNAPIPLSKISPMIELQLDSLGRFTDNAGTSQSYTISNVEITYDLLYADIPIYKQLSTFSFFNNSSMIPFATTGNFTLNFNNPKMKYAKGAFVMFSTYASTSKYFESYDYTNFTGSYNLYFNNNQAYPQKTYYTSISKRSSILMNFKETIRKIYKNNNLSGYISYRDYNYAPSNSAFVAYPSKFIYGVPLCNDYIDGLEIDSNTAILQINTTNSVASPYLANLIICYGINIDITENGLIISK